MRCPKCGSRDDKVIDSRQSRDSSSIRRRRQCLKCGYRFTTYEEIERSDLRVVKRDRTHEPFDRRKLAGSIAKAFEKRSTRLTKSWSRLKKNFPICVATRVSSLSSTAVGCMPPSIAPPTKLVIRVGGSRS